jgi:hypothetical protein
MVNSPRPNVDSPRSSAIEKLLDNIDSVDLHDLRHRYAELLDRDRRGGVCEVDGYKSAHGFDGGSRSTDSTSSTERAAMQRSAKARRDPVHESVVQIFETLRVIEAGFADIAAALHRVSRESLAA